MTDQQLAQLAAPARNAWLDDYWYDAGQDEAAMRAELAAERRNERFFEEGSDSFQAIRFAEDQYEAMRLGL